MKITLKHFITLLNYIAVWFVVRGIWHGFFSNQSSIISGIVWLILFFLSHLLDQRANPVYDTEGNRIHSNIAKAILVSLLFLFGISLVVWGFQYFLDNPYASLIMIPVWYILSLWVYPIKKRLHPVSRWKIIPVWLIIWWLSYIVLNGIIHTIPAHRYNISNTWSIVHPDYLVWDQETKKSIKNLWWITDGRFEWWFISDMFNKNNWIDDINTTWSISTRPSWMDWYNDQDIYTHCIAMTDMDWCAEFLSTYTGEVQIPEEIIEPSVIMDHSSMIKSELDFLALMIPHHQEAVDSSASLLRLPSISPQLRPILENIISGQNTEIRSMLWWLNQRYSWVTYTWEPYMPMMRDTSSISSLPTIENIFIQDMIAHHKWAVQMAEKLLLLSDTHEETINLAQNIIKDQTNEISILEQLLWGTTDTMDTVSMPPTSPEQNTTSSNDATTNTIYPSQR